MKKNSIQYPLPLIFYLERSNWDKMSIFKKHLICTEDKILGDICKILALGVAIKKYFLNHIAISHLKIKAF